MAHMQRKLDESNEVTDAIKTQLVDYKSMVTMLQGQLRRGKAGKGSVAGGTGGSPSIISGPPRSTYMGGEGSVMESGEWPAGPPGNNR